MREVQAIMQERLSVESVSNEFASFLAGFAMGEGSFIISCRSEPTRKRGWRISASFNVSQHDIEPLILFKEILGCGTLRRAGNGGWYFEVQKLQDIAEIIVPFFTRFPLLGKKAQDFERFKGAVQILHRGNMSDEEFIQVLEIREDMNNGGKRTNSMERILRDYTPNTSDLSEVMI